MKILLVEDDPSLARSIREFLEGRQYLVESASTWQSAHEALHLYRYDCAIVDITLPGGSGLDLVRALKAVAPSTGVIIVSARDSLSDKVTGLDLGADDYLTKPFHLAELNARLGSLLRRRLSAGSAELRCGELAIQPDGRQARVGRHALALTRTEFDLLLFLAGNADHVLSKETIAEHLWGSAIDQADSFDAVYDHVKNLRRKLTEAGAADLIRTVYGVGYAVDGRCAEDGP